MAFLTKGEFFKGYAQAIVLDVYTDKVEAMAVKKGTGEAVAAQSAMERQEGPGEVSPERIVLNSAKALQSLPAEARRGVKDLVVALGGGIGRLSFLQVKGIRENPAKKIAREEVDAVISRWYGKEADAQRFVFRNLPHRFSVDGFVVPDPVGLNGKEVVTDIANAACDQRIIRSLEEFAGSAGMRMRGGIDMRAAVAEWKPIGAGADSAMIVCVFESESNVMFARQGAIRGVGTLHGGYGIIATELARAFGVGKEEAMRVLEGFRAGTLDPEAAEAVRGVVAGAARKLGEGIRTMLATADPSSLLPGNIWVVASDDVPEVSALLKEKAWLVGLPLERNARVHAASEEFPSQRATIFDLAVLNYLSL